MKIPRCTKPSPRAKATSQNVPFHPKDGFQSASSLGGPIPTNEMKASASPWFQVIPLAQAKSPPKIKTQRAIARTNKGNEATSFSTYQGKISSGLTNVG